MGEPREVAVLQSRLLRREEELAAAQLENRTLRASQRILEAELRRDDVDSASARIELEGARRSLSESQVVSSSLGASLRHEEGVREAIPLKPGVCGPPTVRVMLSCGHTATHTHTPVWWRGWYGGGEGGIVVVRVVWWWRGWYMVGAMTVSYTHLTLPTICSV